MAPARRVDHQSGRLNVLTFAQNSVDLTQTSKGDDVRYRDVNEMSMTELWHPQTSALAARDYGKFLVEAARRLSAPLNRGIVCLDGAVSQCCPAASSATATCSARFWPCCGVVALLAVQLAVANLAARFTLLIPLVWLVAVAPGLACAWLLFMPQQRLPALAQAAAG